MLSDLEFAAWRMAMVETGHWTKENQAMQDRLDAEEDVMYSAMDEIISEVNPVPSNPPSQELRLRRDLAEWAIRDAAWAEVMARPFEKPGWARDVSIDEWQRWMMEDPYATAERAESMWAWINDPGAQERMRQRNAQLLLAAQEADAPARAREAELLAYNRLPNWETDEPPPLNAVEACVLARHMADGEEGAASRAFEELAPPSWKWLASQAGG